MPGLKMMDLIGSTNSKIMMVSQFISYPTTSLLMIEKDSIASIKLMLETTG